MTAEPPFRCTTAARDREDPQVGTAPQAAGWLLLEHPGPWPVDAVAGSGIAPEVLRRLIDAAATTRVRILLIRRSGRVGRVGPGGVRSWRLLWEGGAGLTGDWRTDEDLLAAVDALTVGPAVVSEAERVILVCAHGVHDACCAIRGRPVAAALAEVWPEEVFECSHVGGDRFAANVVLLPDGFYYGNLDPQNSVETVRAHREGSVPAAQLRGMTAHPPAVQAAVVAAYERLGPLPAGAVRVEHVTADPSSHRSTVALQVPGVDAPVVVIIQAVRRTPAQLTCRAAYDTPATEYRVVAFAPVA